MALTENQRKWVEALRSGEFEQGKNRLNKNGRMCCLGVACELAIKAGIAIKRDEDDGTVRYDGDYAFPPESVVEWLGLRKNNGEYRAQHRKYQDLATHNDNGWSFARVADRIEAVADTLFVKPEAE